MIKTMGVCYCVKIQLFLLASPWPSTSNSLKAFSALGGFFD